MFTSASGLGRFDGEADPVDSEKAPGSVSESSSQGPPLGSSKECESMLASRRPLALGNDQFPHWVTSEAPPVHQEKIGEGIREGRKVAFTSSPSP